MDTRPREGDNQGVESIPHDSQFVRHYYYEDDLRWKVQRSIPFSYEDQLASAYTSIGR